MDKKEHTYLELERLYCWISCNFNKIGIGNVMSKIKQMQKETNQINSSDNTYYENF